MYPHINEPLQRISPKATTMWKMSNTIGHGITLLILAILLYMEIAFSWRDWIGWILYIVTVLIMISAVYSILIEPSILQRTWRYEVDDEHIQLKHGAFTQTHTLIPITKVEYVTTNQGPLLRKFGLYDIKIGSVTTSHNIPAIPAEEALALRAKIAHLAKIKEQD